jgi:hypothetical protein
VRFGVIKDDCILKWLLGHIVGAPGVAPYHMPAGVELRVEAQRMKGEDEWN